MSKFLGKHLPKERDSELAKIQSLASICPLTSAWQLLLDAGLEEDPQMVVPETEVIYPGPVHIMYDRQCLRDNLANKTLQEFGYHLGASLERIPNN